MLDASFTNKISGISYVGGATSSETFHPLNVRIPGSRRAPEPSVRTDLFLWGCVVYELMVGHWPGHGEHAKRSRADMERMIPLGEWPKLERECIGELVRRCWTGAYKSSQRLRIDVSEYLEGEGLGMEAGDDLHFGASPEVLETVTL